MANIIADFTPFYGQHCESTATGSLINQLLGVDQGGTAFSEPMLFGLGEGLGFIFWNMKTMDFPFLGGRIKPEALTQNIARNLNLKLNIEETASPKKAWDSLKNNIDRNIATGLKLDCYYLDYFTKKFHFAAHYVAMYGYDDDFAYLVDTSQQGTNVKTSLKSLELARNEKGHMSSKNLSYTIQGNIKDFREAVLTAIRNNAADYLNPPIKNLGFKGVLKAADEIKKWFKNSKNIERDFITTAILMEKGGTGGALFRNLYRDFLKEAYELTDIMAIDKAYQLFAETAELWTKIAALFDQTGKTKDVEYINQASVILAGISEKEKTAMELLLKI
ncbi:BtrH N-terminal domain-containing protein [Candidatus Magnetominusculus xianensis]|uniref:Lantibiotic ABC transporter n=1 Tax=Candidatus Magnetominusculus xianensis TaxID=1748249 RepID=A0ABR5SI31_9BACT|nr:BtrH N-terminal domain-containing protein [Candidatus Magnetominusculus xianensis]KWT90953.1 lantibiotic ABC transporter [Candidatus Magnetominusculus xianensis]MBF0403109.1 BtrH N-terminal domain-containing protein [Nitrospirota bacterium]